MKSLTLYESYRNLNQKMNAPGITPEKRAELRPLSNQLKTAYKKARVIELSEEAQQAVDRINTLKQHTALTGYRTTRSQVEILNQFTGAELADILSKVSQ